MLSFSDYILFVDDDSDDREIIRLCCEELGVTAQSRFLASGQELLFYLDATEPSRYPSLVVLDFNMPGLNGAETLAALRRDLRFQHLPVALLTTSIRQSLVQTATTAVDVLQKPNNFQQMKAIVAAFYNGLKPASCA